MKWLIATLVAKIRETSTAETLVFDIPDWPGHLPGQHVDVRLTAEDGYSAQRSYSIATPTDGTTVALTVQNVDDGEVSPYLTGVLEVGEQVEMRGPIGGWFVWNESDPAPVLLLAGGSGVVPLMSMLRARRTAVRKTPFRLVYSVRTPAEVMYASELRSMPGGIDVAYRFTREAPDGYRGRVGRLTSDDLVADGWPAEFAPSCFVCGPTGFVEAAADLLVQGGHLPPRIKTERFG
ncbi:ferredoxin reductase [Rhodococcoides fascians]|uniref:ferredoxin reductase n=1 Tax=Rhodococcoides fascians TaxID=1828 RepID=UPI000691D7B0|nr:MULTISPECIES: ferredoxin reductase [Rhodococcus]OZF05342.1 oxidoreductase [Rhodococcus sp. 15-1189-1-1a]OZF20128.1 oxidoreductase [Rhodococcus sp. 14-2686-1-2]